MKTIEEMQEDIARSIIGGTFEENLELCRHFSFDNPRHPHDDTENFRLELQNVRREPSPFEECNLKMDKIYKEAVKLGKKLDAILRREGLKC